MSANLKVLCVLTSIVAIAIGAMSVHAERKSADSDTITLTGMITPDTFFGFQDRLAGSSAKNKTFVITESGGGNWESAWALGILIHRHGWNVEVVDVCASSCANFIFPAGKVKYLHSNALLLFHGGPHQENVMAQAIEADRAAAARHATGASSASGVAGDPGHARKEGHVVIDDKGAQRLRVLEFLSITNVSSGVELVTRLRDASDRFYEQLGVNPLLPSYGQMGRYEPIYKSYKYGGFFYRLDSLRKLGVGNVEVKGGEWQPERHRDFPDLYEVAYP